MLITETLSYSTFPNHDGTGRIATIAILPGLHSDFSISQLDVLIADLQLIRRQLSEEVTKK
jgi:hypothetical protein